jgi:hypothetical protein
MIEGEWMDGGGSVCFELTMFEVKVFVACKEE